MSVFRPANCVDVWACTLAVLGALTGSYLAIGLAAIGFGASVLDAYVQAKNQPGGTP